MKSVRLTIDGAVKMVLGALLLLFPTGILQCLGLPPVQNQFYTTILVGKKTDESNWRCMSIH